eukprot:TRINITY_DN7364_c0_g1_i1.p1 TRINITY_DN7364_c0_g1~~TRINITY_DN7364_c0_g1_i1.p1  ORF type:complete len:341 (+),score=70.86 TRINITY_DN7364_c0_g1_i1:161-1183(+)
MNPSLSPQNTANLNQSNQQIRNQSNVLQYYPPGLPYAANMAMGNSSIQMPYSLTSLPYQQIPYPNSNFVIGDNSSRQPMAPYSHYNPQMPQIYQMPSPMNIAASNIHLASSPRLSPNKISPLSPSHISAPGQPFPGPFSGVPGVQGQLHHLSQLQNQLQMHQMHQLSQIPQMMQHSIQTSGNVHQQMASNQIQSSQMQHHPVSSLQSQIQVGSQVNMSQPHIDQSHQSIPSNLPQMHPQLQPQTQGQFQSQITQSLHSSQQQPINHSLNQRYILPESEDYEISTPPTHVYSKPSSPYMSSTSPKNDNLQIAPHSSSILLNSIPNLNSLADEDLLSIDNNF